MSLNGIDIASFQSKLNTYTINADFIIIKATQGTGYINPTWRKQLDDAIQSGKKVGLYHYANGSGVQGEVNFFLQTVKDYIGKAILCLDWEHIPNGGANPQFYNPTYAKQFMDEVKRRTGVTMFIYGSKDSCFNAMDWSKCTIYPLWGAQYGSYNPIWGYAENPWQSTRPWGAWGSNVSIFQYTSNLRLSGWGAGLDGDICYLTPEQWDMYAGAKDKVTPVKPQKELDKATLLQTIADVYKGKYGNGDQRRDNLGENYEQVQKFIDHIATASDDTLAKEVLTGKYGDGELRKEVLGKRYDKVQAKVNKLLNKQKPITTIAKEIIKGKWGNGDDRVKRLRAAGYDSAAVQKEVNRLLGS